MDTSWLAFLGLSAVVIATPGPDTALTVRNTLEGGRRDGVFTALGVSVGQLVWSVATSLGLIAVVVASRPVFQALKFIGAAYLVFLGLQSLWTAFRGWPRASDGLGYGPATCLTGSRAFRQGVINNLANPKMAVFFASALPAFAPPGHGMLSALLLLGMVFSMLTFLWLALYAVALGRAGRLVRGSRMGRAIDGAAGVALLGLGLKVATEDR